MQAAIKRRDWTQERTTWEVKVSVSTIRRWLRGDAVPGYSELWRVFQAFGDLPFK